MSAGFTRFLFAAAPRWIFYGALVFAPWAYGATAPWGITRLNWIIAVALFCWLAELALNRRLPRVTPILGVTSCFILALGWWMTINASSVRDAQYQMFVPIRQLVSGWPGSVDCVLSVAFMLRVTLLFGSICFVADLSRNPRLVLELWWVVVIAGTSIALLGLVQKATGAQMIFWGGEEGEEPLVTTFFATYYYHGNAGAFLNLTWPFTAGLVMRSLEKNSSPLVRAVLILCLVIELVAVMVNTSRMSQFVGLVLFLLLLALFAPWLSKHARETSWQVAAGAFVFVTMVVLTLAYSSQWQHALARWSSTPEAQSSGGRWDAAQGGWQAAKDAGWLGFGPGTFRAIFRRYSAVFDPDGEWRFLHEDYLQTIIEWGWAGAAAWAVVFFGALWNALMKFRNRGRQKFPTRYKLISQVAAVALTGVLLHAVVDFPLQIASIQLYAAACLGLCWRSPEVRG